MYNLGAPLCNCQRKTRQKKERSSQKGLKSETMIVFKWSWEGPCWRRRFLFFSVVTTLITGVSIFKKTPSTPGKTKHFRHDLQLHPVRPGAWSWITTSPIALRASKVRWGEQSQTFRSNPWDFHQASDKNCQDTSNKKIYCTYLIILSPLLVCLGYIYIWYIYMIYIFIYMHIHV